MRIFLLVFLFMTCINSPAQVVDTIQIKRKVKLIPYDNYKHLKTVKDFTIDSIGYRVVQGDTLIEFKNMDNRTISPGSGVEGVKVAYDNRDWDFLNKYMEVVFERSAHSDAANKSRMRYWKEPLNIYFDTHIPSGDVNEMKEFINYLNKNVDSLHINYVDALKESNYQIYYNNTSNDPGTGDAHLKNMKDGYYVYWNGKNQINRGVLTINSDEFPEFSKRLTVMKINFYRSLGHFSQTEGMNCTSLLARCWSPVYPKDLTTGDMEILQYHYSYGICKGTDVKTFVDQHTRAKESLKNNKNNKFYFVHPD